MLPPKPRKISLPRFLRILQERVAFGEGADRGQNTAYAVLVQALAARGACTVAEVAEGLKEAEADARRMNEHAATIRQLRSLRVALERLSPDKPPSPGEGAGE